MVGVTGRTLHLNPGWDNPAGEWRVGTKLAYELFDPSLVSRLKGERRQATSEQQRGLVSAALNGVAHTCCPSYCATFLKDSMLLLICC